jgi:hypothetical protein
MQANYAGEPIKEHDDKLTAAEIQQAEAEAADFIRGVIERAKEGPAAGAGGLSRATIF